MIPQGCYMLAKFRASRTPSPPFGGDGFAKRVCGNSAFAIGTEFYGIRKGLFMKYEFGKSDKETIRRLIELSKKWQEENCSYGILANTEDDITPPLCVAMENEEIVGYIFGHYYVTKQQTSCIPVGCQCFSVDELYVLPEYRSQGIGRELFARMETDVRSSCAYLTLNTSTKDHRKILHFYVDELDMRFHSAFLFKPVEE